MALPFPYILVLFLSVSVVQTISQPDARISLGSSLTAMDDDTSSWQSPSGDFAFGFRRLENQNLYILAIWFNKIPDKTIIWYANGDNPAPEKSKIELKSDGQFTLNSPEGEVIWKPEPLSTEASHAAMLDTGNFILANNDSKYLWESFNHPTDTILPTQVLEINGVLSSRQTKTSFSKGRFQLRLLPEGNLVLNTISPAGDYSYGPYYRSETKDDTDSMNSGYRVVFNETGFLYVVRRNGNVVNLTSGNIASSRDFYHRATLDFDGIFMQYAHWKSPRDGSHWDEAWFSVWYEPKNICFDFAIPGDLGSGACGFNSYCSLDSYGRPTCECLPGFSLVDQGNKYSDCKVDRVQRCQPSNSEVYEMSHLGNVFWPTSSNYEIFPLSSEDECTKACLDDCNCVVAVIKNGLCHKKKLPLSNGRLERDTYGKALIKIPKVDASFREEGSRDSSHRDKKDQSTLVLVVSILLGSSLLLNFILVAATSLVAFYSYKKAQTLNRGSSLLETNLRVFTYEELKEATDGFREELGRGAFGTVFKGILTSFSSGSKLFVAIKKLEKFAEEGEKEFKTEASTIAKTHHKNLVRLLGFCDEKSNRLLVYEFMSNGTLASYLFGISRPDWNKRMQIAYGIARGIMYLHEECSTQIIHCDIKPQNILLDDTFTARISDFGLAKLLISDQSQTITAIRGTKGYVAPEWFRSAPVTSKVDVYSYGVMLLEIICCRKNVEAERENEEEVILVDWVYDCYKSRNLEKLVENDEEARNDMKRVERLVIVGIWCIQEDPSLRPLMKKVVQMLEGVVEVSLPPCPSPFTSIC